MSDDQKSITNLVEYIEAINGLAGSGEKHRYVYRGQKNERWKVQSSALRRLQKHPLKHIVSESHLFRGYIHHIISEVQLRYPNTYSNLTTLEGMAHLQHNRVATGLIDFTYSPLVALWFACETDGATDGKVVVVSVQPDTIKEVKTKGTLEQKLKTFFAEDGQWYLWQPSIGNPALETQRLTVQQSVFLFGAPEIEDGMIERGIIVSKDHKNTLLRELGRMGISEKTLFPDLAGFFERNTVESAYNADLAEEAYYAKEVGKEKSIRNDETLDDELSLHSLRGALRFSRGKYQEAIEDYDEIINIIPDISMVLSDVYHSRGRAKLLQLGRTIESKVKRTIAEGAIADYDKAIELKPDFVEAYASRGFAKTKLGKHKAALADYDQIIELKPDFAAAYYNRGNVKQQLGHNAEALADFKHALTLAQQQGGQELAQEAEAAIKELESAQVG